MTARPRPAPAPALRLVKQAERKAAIYVRVSTERQEVPSERDGKLLFLATELKPDEAKLVAERKDQFRKANPMLSKLDDDGLRQVAVRKLEGFSNEEIAEQMNCTVRTIGRRLALIRDLWEDKEEGRVAKDED